jgi:hypothetical protein
MIAGELLWLLAVIRAAFRQFELARPSFHLS